MRNGLLVVTIVCGLSIMLYHNVSWRSWSTAVLGEAANTIITTETPVHETKTATTTPEKRERFLLYLCDSIRYCYGLGDRQRAIVGLYILSLVTNRTFGIVWTYPSSFTDYYEPNQVPWVIDRSRLQWETSIELEFLSTSRSLDLTIPLNVQYPQDVIYVRTNHMLIPQLQKSAYYRPRLPKWALKPYYNVIGDTLPILMKPKESLRRAMNEVLVSIARDMSMDIKLRAHMNKSRICNGACDYLLSLSGKQQQQQQTPKPSNKSPISLPPLSPKTYVTECISEIEKKKDDFSLKDYKTNITAFISTNTAMFCPGGTPTQKKTATTPNAIQSSVESIQKSKQFAMVNLNLVCLHVRVGKSSTLPFDPVRNTMDSTKVLWDFVRPLVSNGQHIYVATDSQQVRDDAKRLFGSRVHVSNAKIVHIASITHSGDEAEGMKLALWEQLLLMTSCQTLVESHSGFSTWAGSVRRNVYKGQKHGYLFRNGKIVIKN